MSDIAIFQAAWSSSLYCNGPPVAMYVFNNEQNTTDVFKYMTEQSGSVHDNMCGSNPKARSTSGCCFSSLDKTSTKYTSVTQELMNSPSDVNGASIFANGQQYCKLTPKNSESLWGFNQAYYLSGSDCHDSFIKCSSQGVAEVFPQSNCTGKPVSINSNSTLPHIGEVNMQFLKFSGGEGNIVWTAMVPATLLVPDYSTPMEYVENISFAVSAVLSIGIVIYLIMKYRARKTQYMLWLLLSQCVWLLWVLLDAYYYNSIFNTSESLGIFSEIKSSLFALATFATVLNTTNFLIAFTHLRNKTHRRLAFVVVFLLHVLLCGGKYFDYLRLQQSITGFFQRWQLLVQFWIIGMFIYNTIPSFFVTLAIIRIDMEDMSIIQALLKLQRVNTKFSVLVLIQLVNLFSYILMTSYQNYSESWGNDRNFLAINGPINLCYVIHSAVNCLFIEHVRVILKLRSQISSTAMSTHHNSSNISSINYPVKPTNDSSLPSVKRELPTSIPPTQGNPKVNRYVNPSSLMPKID